MEYLATHLAEARKGHRNTLTVAAGDMIGASPLLSAAFHDEPTIEAMNELGLDVTSVGNHEFDEGYKELQRMQAAAASTTATARTTRTPAPTTRSPAPSSRTWPPTCGTPAPTRRILPAYWIKKMHGAKVGFIGMTLKDTPTIVTAAGVAGPGLHRRGRDRQRAGAGAARRKGVKAIVVLIHQGGVPTATFTDPRDGRTVTRLRLHLRRAAAPSPATAPIIPIAESLDPADRHGHLGHTHQPYVCNIPDPDGQPRLVTSASSFGRLFTETDLTYDRRTQRHRPLVGQGHAT